MACMSRLPSARRAARRARQERHNWTDHCLSGPCEGSGVIEPRCSETLRVGLHGAPAALPAPSPHVESSIASQHCYSYRPSSELPSRHGWQDRRHDPDRDVVSVLSRSGATLVPHARWRWCAGTRSGRSSVSARHALSDHPDPRTRRSFDPDLPREEQVARSRVCSFSQPVGRDVGVAVIMRSGEFRLIEPGNNRSTRPCSPTSSASGTDELK